MALITTLVLCARSHDLVMSVSVRMVHVVLSTLLDLRAEESRVVRHVKPPRSGEASRRPRALSRVRTQAIGALAQGSYPLSYPSAHPFIICFQLVPRTLVEYFYETVLWYIADPEHRKDVFTKAIGIT